MSPAAIILSILNFFDLFALNPLVSLAKTANPSKAELFADGFFDGDKISSDVTLFKAFSIETLSVTYYIPEFNFYNILQLIIN